MKDCIYEVMHAIYVVIKPKYLQHKSSCQINFCPFA